MTNRAPVDHALGRRTLHGAAWTTVAGFVAKFVALGVQIALGWLLIPDDFAIFAMAIAVTVAVAFLHDGGVSKILSQRPAEFARLVSPAILFSMICNGVAAASIAAFAPFADAVFDTAGLAPVLLVVAAATLLRTPATILRARLQVGLRFKSIAAIDLSAATIRGVASVSLAAAGYGAMALALPILVATVVEAALMICAGAASGWSMRRFGRDLLLEVIRPARWVMVSTGAASLAARGDYLVLGILAPGILGMYFFGYNLAHSLLVPVALGVQAVMMPTLSWMVNDPGRYAAAAARAFRLMAFASAALAAVAWLAMPAAIHLIWQGRWDPAIPVAVAVAASLAFRGVVPLAFALVESQGRWALRAGLLAVDGATLGVAVGTTTVFVGEDISSIALAMALQQTVMAVVIVAVSERASRLRFGTVLRWPVQWGIVAVVLAIASRGAAGFVGTPDQPLAAIVAVLAFSASWVAVLFALGATERRELRHLIPWRR